MSKLVDTVTGLVAKKDQSNLNSEFYKNYIEFSEKYEELIKLGVTKKREPQVTSLFEKILLDFENYNQSNTPTCL